MNFQDILFYQVAGNHWVSAIPLLLFTIWGMKQFGWKRGLGLGLAMFEFHEDLFLSLQSYQYWSVAPHENIRAWVGFVFGLAVISYTCYIFLVKPLKIPAQIWGAIGIFFGIYLGVWWQLGLPVTVAFLSGTFTAQVHDVLTNLLEIGSWVFMSTVGYVSIRFREIFNK